MKIFVFVASMFLAIFVVPATAAPWEYPRLSPYEVQHIKHFSFALSYCEGQMGYPPRPLRELTRPDVPIVLKCVRDFEEAK